MTENKGDLISRSALKAELEVYRHTRNYKSDEDEAQNCLLDNILEDIDNAPTVENDIEVATKDAYEHGYADGWKERFGEPDGRQKGEWIDRMADKGYVECPFCHKQITGGDLNFCVKCGADMRSANNG